MKYIFISIFVWGAIPPALFAQFNDFQWALGYDLVSDSIETYNSIMLLDFREIEKPDSRSILLSQLDFIHTNAGICNEEGEVLFYFDGQNIEDRAFEIMSNGVSINEYSNIGYDLPQGALVLPWPDRPNHYVLFHQTLGISWFGWGAYELRYSVIDMAADAGRGAVVQRRQFLLYEPLSFGQLTATRHANGRDWWVLVNAANSNRYFRFLLGPNGVQQFDEQVIGSEVFVGVGQSVFSPDGNWHVRFSSISSEFGCQLCLYAFDRCTGLLGNPVITQFDWQSLAAGAAFSPNSRYLYTSISTEIHQYDMFASDIVASRQTVAIYDGFANDLPTTFYQMQLAPDGKLYACATNGVKYLHIIHRPDLPGSDCHVEQHGLELISYNGVSLPNFPNYRLGPIDGSTCDTLGIDNVPVALFRFLPDTIQPRHFGFHDLSFYEPQTWVWSFGDGYASSQQHPSHTYAQDGQYEVCLTVSNPYGVHTRCRTLTVGLVAANPEVVIPQARLYPNPVSRWLSVDWPAGSPGQMVLFDARGAVVHEVILQPGSNRVDLGALPAGVFFYVLRQRGQVGQTGKLIKVNSLNQ